MKVYKTNNLIELNKNDILSSGGQGTVYIKNNLAYKIYHKKKHAIPKAKIQELSYLAKDNIIKPIDELYNNKKEIIGYTMSYIDNTYALCRLFTDSFKKRYSIKNSQIIKLVEKFRQDLHYIHSKNILIVDLNEMNFLIDNNIKNIYFIDVDSYQTTSFSAGAIMDSVRDRHSKKFSILTDWFSWAIITFQIFTGIHPYKGKHNTFKTLDERMLNNISVFNKTVRKPGSCGDLMNIPENLRKWYQIIFETNSRSIPPAININEFHYSLTQNVILQGETLDIKKILELNENILNADIMNSRKIIRTKNKIIFDNMQFDNVTRQALVFSSPADHKLYAVKIENECIYLFDFIYNKKTNALIHGEKLMKYDGRIYVKSYENVFELLLFENYDNIKVIPVNVGNVMLYSTMVFDGVFIQYMLNTCFITIFPETRICYHLKIDELTEYRVIEAKYDNNVMIASAYKNGKYDKFIFRFDKQFKTYDIRLIENIDSTDINFVVLDNGVCVNKKSHTEIELFSNIKNDNNIKIIRDKNIELFSFFKNSTELFAYYGNSLYKLGLKN